ncbi:hypothetical protein KAI04_00130 [Candidatus Pacearchaeota archaeon]|nr:hypothetical protein [Candidatus Pacearchaeota archaeon]
MNLEKSLSALPNSKNFPLKNYVAHIDLLKEFNKGAYKNWKRLVRIATRKTRKSKFKG